jgi:hypothetical protein
MGQVRNNPTQAKSRKSRLEWATPKLFLVIDGMTAVLVIGSVAGT